jgi:hypothetical protein
MGNFRPILAFVILCLTFCAPALISPAEAADPLRSALELRKKYAAEIEQLAAWCESNGLADEARQTRLAIIPNDPYKHYVPELPDLIGPPPLPKGASEKAVEWHERFWRLRRDHSAALFDMARGAIRGGRAGLAFELALASIQANPDYEAVRRLFGYQKFRDRWCTAYEVRQLRAGKVWSERFGWLPKAHLRRYEDGERYSGGRWISAAEDAQRHADIQSGWDIETEHYVIRTNHGIESAVALGVKLERLNRLWRQLFVRYYASEADVLALFDGRAKAAPPPEKLDIVYFRDRDDYIRSLKPAMPNVGISTGVYVERTRRAYFYADKQPDDRTLYHEATHQLFHQSRPVAPGIGQKANFWIIEGIAMYMESLRREDGYLVLGGRDDERLHAARYRLLHDNFYVPFGDFVGYGMETFQKDPRIATLYSQAAGQTHFLVHGDGGKYRDALVAYLSAVYSGRDDHDTLAKLTAAGYDDLDKQYRLFIEAKGEK